MLGPLLYKLLNRTLKNCDSDCRLVKMMKLKMKEDLHGCYTDSVLDWLHNWIHVSSLLLSDSEKLRIEDHIIAEAAECCISQTELLPLVGQHFMERGSCSISLRMWFSHKPAAKIPQMFLTMTKRLGGKLHCTALMFTILKVMNRTILILYNGGQVQR